MYTGFKHNRSDWERTVISCSSLHIATTKVTPVKTVTAKSVARDARPHPDSQIHYVTIGSANAVIKDATKRDKLKKNSWALCAEIEPAGLMDESPCLVIQLFSGHAPSLRNSIHLRNPIPDTCPDSRCRNHNDNAFSSASLSQISSRISYTLSPTRAAS